MAGKRRLKSSKPAPAPRPASSKPRGAKPAAPGSPRADRAPRRGRAKRGDPLPWGRLAAALALVVAAVGVAALGRYLLTPHRGDGRAVRVAIPSEGGAAELTRALWRAGVIDHPWLFHALMAVTGARPAAGRGVLLLRDDLTPRAVLRALGSAGSGVIRVTIPEGFTRFEIARRLEASGVCGAEAFLARSEDPATLERAGLPARVGVFPRSLEGWLFPDTYDFAPDSAPEAVIARMTQVMARRLDAVKSANPDGALRAAALLSSLPPELRAAAPGEGVARDPIDRAIVTLASLVERETGAPEDRARIASVFWNRLSRSDFVPHLLQSDPTVTFGCRVMLRAQAPDAGGACEGARRGVITAAMLSDATNPWNTYRHEALPPTPICNPGVRALEATLAPSADEDLYFVARGDGRSVFARTLEAHRENVRRWLRRGPRDGGTSQ